MTKTSRRTGRTIRKLIQKIAKLDRAWRLEGRPEGRLENQLAFELGNAYRAGIGGKARKVQCVSAARLGQRSGWETKA